MSETRGKRPGRRTRGEPSPGPGARPSKGSRSDGGGGGRRPGKAGGGRPAVAQTGRRLGPRALRTRQRLLEATAELLRERSVLDISVVDIARKVGTSPATFYHYFRDVEEAALRLAEQAADEMPAVVGLIDRDWRGAKGLDTARAIVEAFLRHWEAHHAVLVLRNLAADRGDRRFQRVRRAALAPVLEHLADRIREGQELGRVPSALHPYAAAAALASILERLSAHGRELGYFDVRREDLIETCARVLHQVVTGRIAR